MTVKTNKFKSPRINLQFPFIYVVLALIASIAFISGCSLYSSVSRKTKNITRGYKGRDKDLKKIIGMAPFDSRTPFLDQNLETNFYETLIGMIESKCPGIVILHSAAGGYPEFLNDLPGQTAGKTGNLEIAKNGRAFGLNAIMTIALTGINDFETQKGFWWFKDTHYFFRVQMKIEMYDTETGTKLLDEFISRNVEVEAFDVELFKNRKSFDPFLIEDAFEYFSITTADKVCDVLVVQPWKGYIISVTADKVILSSGANSGLRSGRVLEVFDSSEIIQGADGYGFIMPGPKTGQLEITAVYDDSAEAVVTAGSEVRVGNMVKTKN